MNNYLMRKLSKEHFLLSSLIADVRRRSTRIIFHNDPIPNVNLLKLDTQVKKGSKIIQHSSDAISIINLDVFRKRICDHPNTVDQRPEVSFLIPGASTTSSFWAALY